MKSCQFLCNDQEGLHRNRSNILQDRAVQPSQTLRLVDFNSPCYGRNMCPLGSFLKQPRYLLHYYISRLKQFASFFPKHSSVSKLLRWFWCEQEGNCRGVEARQKRAQTNMMQRLRNDCSTRCTSSNSISPGPYASHAELFTVARKGWI